MKDAIKLILIIMAVGLSIGLLIGLLALIIVSATAPFFHLAGLVLD